MELEKHWTDSFSTEDLQDVRLDDGAQSECQRKSTRPECISGIFHEILLALVTAFIGATFLILQRSSMVVTDTVRHSLGTDMSATAWMLASPG